jgi:hypothetical protein
MGAKHDSTDFQGINIFPKKRFIKRFGLIRSRYGKDFKSQTQTW